MNRQIMEQLFHNSVQQISHTYHELFIRVMASDAEKELATAEAMVNMGLAETTEIARIRIQAARIGMMSAENRLADSLNQLTVANLEASPLLKEMFAGDSSLSKCGHMAELRELLLELADEAENDCPENLQAFAQLSEAEQLLALGELYQKALDKAAEVGLNEFDEITGAIPKTGKLLNEDAELLYAISVAEVLQKSGAPMEAYERYETAGAYTRTAVYMFNKNANEQRVDPVLSEYAIDLLACILTLVTIVFLYYLHMKTEKWLELVTINLNALGRDCADVSLELNTLTKFDILTKLTNTSQTDILLKGGRLLDHINPLSETVGQARKYLEYAHVTFESLHLFSIVIAGFALEPAIKKLLQKLNDRLTERKQIRRDRERMLTEGERDAEIGREIRMASLMY